MIQPHQLAYAQARVQARFAQRLGERDWQRLGAVRSFGPYLREVRTTVLREWLAGISERSDSHEIEQGLRQQFRRSVTETEGWVPEPWRPAVAWVGWLPLLPLLHPLLLGERAPVWLSRDPTLGPCLDGQRRLRPEKLAAASGGELLGGGSAGLGLVEVWLAGWRRRWPPVTEEVRTGLERLRYRLATHWTAGAAGPDDPAGAPRLLREPLERLFHRSVLQPAMLFAYLGLVALDLRRLRGELIGRALFQGGDGLG